MTGPVPDNVRVYIEQLHALTDQLLEPLEVAHAPRLQCQRGCASCCVDDITVFEVEADRIVGALAGRTLAAGPLGACAFLDAEGSCRVYAVRPYVCRTQGLPLRWGEETADGAVEHRDICPLNEGEPAIEVLPPEACWTLGPVETRLASAQRSAQAARGDADDAPLVRVRLRDLLSGEGVPAA